ncbi:FlgO family outer membrane protein [Desulfonatronospira sp.]|uniref:FlgO family outer membrane protein n=1 Tax=Desulfonatronospira sp. TaxID=1962951 RepID=UPI0025C1A7FB|nr:FlgO family outer membrane protein [Desulfonatronospira sp.]
MKRIFSLMLLMLFIMSGQYTVYAWQPQFHYQKEGLPGIAYQAADMLEYNITRDLSRTLPIMPTSFVDVSDLNSTSVLGRHLGELIGSRLSQHGYNVVEMKLRKHSVRMSPGRGEFALSRDMDHLKNSWNAQAIITGTYHVQGERVMVTAKLVKTTNNSVISSHDFSFRLDGDLKAMTQAEDIPEERRTVDDRIINGKGPLSEGAIILNPARSTDAKLIQNRLAELGLYLDRIDGIWGRNSKRALEMFKSRNQLPDPQKWDARTQIRLFRGTGQ